MCGTVVPGIEIFRSAGKAQSDGRRKAAATDAGWDVRQKSLRAHWDRARSCIVGRADTRGPGLRDLGEGQRTEHRTGLYLVRVRLATYAGD